MSAGDEVGALVVDIGSSTVKAGYAGEDCPRSVFPSFVGQLGDAEGDTKAEKLFGDDAVHHRRDGLEIRSPLKDGLVEDWELFEGLLDHAVQKSLGCDSSQHPLLLVEPSFNTPEKRAKMVEIAFEKLHAPAVFLSKSAVLSAFANGKPTALVLESGGGVSAAVPVVDGYALQKAIVRSSLTGSRLTEILKRLLKHGRHDIKPPFCYKKTELPGEEWNVKEVQHPNTTSSFWEYHVDEVVRNIKETDCKVYASGPFDPILNENIPAVQHQLPSEEIVKIHMERFELTEFMLNPSLLKRHADAGVLDLFSQQGDTGTTVDLPLSFDRMAVSAISKCEADVRKDLCNNFIVCGGNTLFPGLQERIESAIKGSLVGLVPGASVRTRFISSSNTNGVAARIERKYAPWIGGSIVASLGSFQQMWISREEYEEAGPVVVERKCP